MRRRAWLAIVVSGLGGCSSASGDAVPEGDTSGVSDAADADGRDDVVVDSANVDTGSPVDSGVRDTALADTSAPDTAAPPPCVGAGCVTATTCASGATEAVYVGESVPTAALDVGAIVDVWVTFANCGKRTWTAAAAGAPTGFKLGSQAPQDNTTWGASRFALPADVPPAHAVKIPFALHAPTSPGSYAFSWAIVEEGVAWLAASSPVVSLNVAAKTKLVTLCAGVTADAGGGSGASAALQKCIDATPSGGTLALPAGIYRIDAQLKLGHPMTLSTAGLATSTANCLDAGVDCAVLQAATDLDVPGGMLALSATDHVLLDHLVLDGNRGARLSGGAAAKCAAGNNRNGFNAMNQGATDVSFTNSASIRAVCGTGFEWRGDRATVTNSIFRDNGENAVTNMWSDGLTLLQSDGAKVVGNRFENNSDVSFICGGARGATLKDNQFLQSTQVAFAAFMMDNFNGGTSGDFTGTTASAFTIACTAQRCHFGVEIGPHAWYTSANTIGGVVTGITVTGARQGMNVEGGGTAAAPVKIFGNSITGSPTSASFNCGTRSTSNVNYSPDSFVDRAGDTTPATSVTWHGCP